MLLISAILISELHLNFMQDFSSFIRVLEYVFAVLAQPYFYYVARNCFACSLIFCPPCGLQNNFEYFNVNCTVVAIIILLHSVIAAFADERCHGVWLNCKYFTVFLSYLVYIRQVFVNRWDVSYCLVTATRV